MRKIIQVICGVGLCVAIVLTLIYSPVPWFWEHEDQPLVYSITWHSAVVLVVLFLFTQGIAYFVFRQLGRRPRKS